MVGRVAKGSEQGRLAWWIRITADILGRQNAPYRTLSVWETSTSTLGVEWQQQQQQQRSEETSCLGAAEREERNRNSDDTESGTPHAGVAETEVGFGNAYNGSYESGS